MTDTAPQFTAPLNSSVQPDTSEPPTVDIFKGDAPAEVTEQAPVVLPPSESQASSQAPVNPAPELPPIPAPSVNVPTETLADLDRKNRADMHADAQAAVAAAFSDTTPPAAAPSAAPDQPALPPLPPAEPAQPADSAPAGLPPLPDFSKMPEPALPPLPQFGPPSGALPPEQLGQIFTSPQPQAPQPPAAPSDPNQFKIPGAS